jgi:hypothetical protein
VSPIDVFYSWQSLVLAVAVAGTVQAVKTGIDTVYGVSPARRRNDPATSARVVGREIRKSNVVLTRGFLPLLPIFMGALLAVLVPLHPEILTVYAEGKAGNRDWTIYALWGAAIGQFADYLYQQIKRNLLGRFNGGSSASNPPSEPPASPSVPPDGEVEDHPNA